MTVKVAPVFPASAPLTRNPKVPQKFRAVLWEQYLLPTVAENLSTLLGISVGFLPDSVVGATFEREKFGAKTTWAVARFHIELQDESIPAFLIQPLADALDWGAIGMRRPPATRETTAEISGGEVLLTEPQQGDLAAYHEVCNVVTCGVLARAWRSKLGRPLAILLDGVEARTPAGFPPELDEGKWVILQASFGYSERPVKPVKGQPPQYEKQTVWLFVVPEALALKALWGAPDGKEKDKTAWLVSTGQWK